MSNGHNSVVVPSPSNPKIVEKYRTISVNITDPSELNQLASFREKVLFERVVRLDARSIGI